MQVIHCGVALIRKDKKFLIAQRNAGGPFGSFWEFPGGKKRPRETLEECVVREVREELGVEAAAREKFLDVRDERGGRVIWLHFYLCSLAFGKPKPLGCQKALWVDVGELKNFTFPPANDVVIEKLGGRFAWAGPAGGHLANMPVK